LKNISEGGKGIKINGGKKGKREVVKQENESEEVQDDYEEKVQSFYS